MDKRHAVLLFLMTFCLSVQASELPEACRYFLSKVSEALRIDSLDHAEGYVRQALKQVNSTADSVQCISAIGEAYYRTHKYEQALSYTSQAIALNIDSLYATTNAYYYHARSLYQMGRSPREMARCYEKTITLLGHHDHRSARMLKAYCLVNLGQYYTKVGDTERSITNYSRALTLGQTKELKKTPMREMCHIELGIAYMVEAQFSAAIDHFQQALSLDFVNPYNKAVTYDRMAETYMALGNYQEALSYQEKAIRLYQEWEDTLGVLTIQAQQAELLTKMGRYEASAELLHEVFDTWHEQVEGESRELGKIHLVAGNTYFHLKKYEFALSHFQQAMQVVVDDSLRLSSDPHIQPSQEMIYPENIFQDGLNGKGKAFLARYRESRHVEDLEAAFSSFALAMKVDDILRKEFGLASSKTLLATETHWRTGLALETVHVLEKEKGSMIDTVFSLMEHSRAMDLYGTLIEAKASIEEGMPKEVNILRKEMKMALSDCEEYWQGEVAADSACAESRHQYDSLLQVLEKNYPTYGLKKFQFDMKGLEDVQANLKPDEALIEYFWGETSLYGLMINKDSAIWKRLDQDNILADLLHQLDLSQASSDLTTASLLHRLYLQLLAPFDSLPSSLIIIPDSTLHTLPFEALMVEAPDSLMTSQLGANFWKGRERIEGGASYVLYAHRIQYAYSATLLYSSDSELESEQRMATFAPTYSMRDSFQGTMIPPLHGNAEHAKRLSQIAGSEVMIGAQANQMAFLQTAANYDLLHLALHGYSDTENPLTAALAFSRTSDDQGIVYAAKLYGLPPLQAKLISLLSCETGAGQYAKGEGIMSLARAFRYAGANSVLMSLWQADTGPGMEIMEGFYTYLSEGKSKSFSLRQAKLDWIHNADAIGAHPSKWSNFVLIGAGDPIRSTPSMLPYVIGAILLLGGFLLYRQLNTV